MAPMTTDTIFQTATGIHQLVLMFTWRCLSDMPFQQKDVLYARIFSSLAVLSEIALSASLSFAPGLWDAVQSVTPATIHFFKTLPTDAAGPDRCWGVYVIVLEKRGCQPKRYIGSATSERYGVSGRFNCYVNGSSVPRYVQVALNEGYIIVHKGLLCWIPNPSAANVPRHRLLIYALEATLSFMFWGMRTIKSDYGMAHICLWDHYALEYDGLCSHCCLLEAVRGDFDLTPELLEAQAVEQKQKRKEIKLAGTRKHHADQTATNQEEYLKKRLETQRRNTAANPGKKLAGEQANRAKAHAEKRFYCVRCDITFVSNYALDKHLGTAKHARKAKESSNTFRCAPCNLGYASQGSSARHESSPTHLKKIRAVHAASSKSTFESSRNSSVGSSSSGLDAESTPEPSIVVSSDTELE